MSYSVLFNAKKVTDHGLTEIAPQFAQLKFKIMIFFFLYRMGMYLRFLIFSIIGFRSSLVFNQASWKF